MFIRSLEAAVYVHVQSTSCIWVCVGGMGISMWGICVQSQAAMLDKEKVKQTSD